MMAWICAGPFGAIEGRRAKAAASAPADAPPKAGTMIDLTTTQTIEFDVTDRVATVTLNRPDQLNCFNEQMSIEISAAWARVRDDEDIRCAVLQANGDRAFCTGIDVSEGKWWADKPIFDQEDPGGSLAPKAHRVWKPVIAALHGMVAGGAMYFVNESDFSICSESATFFDPHLNAGIVSALEPMGMLSLGVPYGDVLRWALLGSEERMTAYTALRLGLVTEVVPDDQLRQRAKELAGEIAQRRPDLVLIVLDQPLELVGQPDGPL